MGIVCVLTFLALILRPLRVINIREHKLRVIWGLCGSGWRDKAFALTGCHTVAAGLDHIRVWSCCGGAVKTPGWEEGLESGRL